VIGLLLPGHCATQTPYLLYEAEAQTPPGEVVVDADASGGKYVQRLGDYQPVCTAPVPRETETTWTVWVRYKGGAIQLKGVDATGKQTELSWLWESPEQFTWRAIGRYSATQLGTSILFIRAPGKTPVAIDAVIFARDAAFDPNRIDAPVAAQVHWQQTIATTTPLSFGLNCYAAGNPDVAADPQYRKNMAYLHAGVLRYHNWGMLQDSSEPNGWLDTAHHGWDRRKIALALAAPFSGDPARMINIPGFPAWMDANNDGLLDSDQFDAFARFCADLVRIVNVEQKRHLKYWEVTNEWDGKYFIDFYTNSGYGPLKDAAKPDRVRELCEIYNRCARAMKAMDPNIEVGGPALARSDMEDFTRRFILGTVAHLDFFTVHIYASGDRADSDGHVYDAAETVAERMAWFSTLLAQKSPTRRIPVLLDEFNISWSWENRDPRMTTEKGAVFDALVFAAAARGGATGTMAWNERDGIYGKMDNTNVLRPSAHLFHLCNTYLIGAVAATHSDAPRAVVAFAVRNAEQHRWSLLLINRSDTDHTTSITCTGAPMPVSWQLYEISTAGYLQLPYVSSGTQVVIRLPRQSVTVLTGVK